MNLNSPQGPDSDMSFLPEREAGEDEPFLAPWKVMIVDDEPGVHAATRLALKGIRFRGRTLEFLSAYSGKEGLALLQDNPDTAVIFLDVVMETDDAGLRTARQIRDDGFGLVRIVLRTGHPGYAPEREVVVNYDIHDYKEKSSLDFSKLFSCLISALRAYGDLVAIEQHRRGLVSVLEAVSWFDCRSLQRYLSRMLAELSSLAEIDVTDLLLAVRPPAFSGPCTPANTTAERFAVVVDGLGKESMTPAEREFICQTLDQQAAQTGPAGATFFASAFRIDLALFTRDRSALDNADRVLLELFLHKVAQALDNHRTFSEILSERDSMVRGIADQNEQWGGHESHELETIQRLARETAARLQQRLSFPDEIDDWFVFSIGTASGFHDLGMQAVPHQLFEKPGALSDEELASIRQHAQHGAELLKMRMGSLAGSRLYAMSEKVIAQHHERYDGSGYPAQLSGNDIALGARIIGLVDTFVAMTATRPYRAACTVDAAVAYVRAGSGRQFDPRVVDAFLEVLAEQA